MNHTRTTAGETRTSKFAAAGGAFALALGILLPAAPSAGAQTAPAATASSSSTLIAINGNAGHVAANSLGDAFYISQADNIAYWLPRGATTPVSLVTGLSGGRNVYVDAKNNVYIPNTYSGNIIEVPFVGGTYATNIAAGGTAACTSVTPTIPCQQGSAGAVLSYYYQPLDISMDAAGNLYTIDVYPNGQCTKGDCVVQFPRGTSTYGAPVVLADNIVANNYNAQFAAAPNGDVYFADGSQVYYLAKGTSSAITVGSFTNPTGVTTDAAGNVYITNSSAPNAIYEFPVGANGIAQPAMQFALLSTYSGNGIALDGLGDLFYTGYNGGTNLNVASLNAVNLGSSAVGTIASAAPASITFTFGANTTPAAITSTGSGFTLTPGSCTAGTGYAAGSSCTVNVSFTSTAVGLQRGGVTLASASGASLATALVSGIGLGAAQTNDPGTLTSIGSSFVSPQGIRVDASGNVFVADPGQNAVLRYAAGGGAPTTIGTGLSKPTSITLDGSGNVFIADAGNGRVVEVPNLNGTLTNSAQTVIATGLGSTLSIVSDRFGNLYIADAAKTTITRLGSVGGTPSTSAQSTIGSGFTMPYALAVDFTGNLFVADYGTNLITEISFYGQTQSTLGAGLSKPTGLVTDAAGSLYIADSGNNRLLKVPFENGAYNTNDQYLVGFGIATPYGVAIDPAGNLYVTDSSSKAISRINRIAGTLSLGRAEINTTTAPSNGYIGNAGNQPLVLGTPAYTATSATPGYFSVSAPAPKGCGNGASLATGSSCTLAATFSPTTTGTFSDLLTFSSNAANGAPQTLTITGLAVNLAATTVTLAQTAPAGTAAFRTPVTIQATIASTVTGTPTGTVTFSVDGAVLPNAPATVNNAASITLPNLTGGSHTITATYSGDAVYGPNNKSLTITIAQAASSTTLAFSNGVLTNPTSATPASNVTLLATIKVAAGTAPTGGVTFMVGSTVLNTTPAPLMNGAGGYTATLVTAALPVGSDTVTATYNGDVNYALSSGASAVIISYQTFTITPTTASITVNSGETGTVALTATSLSGFASNPAYLGLTCTGLPTNASCAFNPNNFLFIQGTPQNITMQIVTGQTPVVGQPVTGGFGKLKTPASWAILMLALSPLAMLNRRKTSAGMRALRTTAFVLMLGCGTSLFSGCGSSLFGKTPSGTYQVKVLATGSVGGYTGPTTAANLAAGCATAVDPVAFSTPTTELTCQEIATVTLVVK